MIALRVMAVTLALVSNGIGQVPQDRNIKDKLIGAWDVVKVQDPKKQKLPVGAAVLFGKDNTFQVIVFPDNKPTYIDGAWSLEKDELTVTFKDGDRQVHEVIKIVNLTEEEMKTTNSDGQYVEYTKRKKHRIE